MSPWSVFGVAASELDNETASSYTLTMHDCRAAPAQSGRGSAAILSMLKGACGLQIPADSLS